MANESRFFSDSQKKILIKMIILNNAVSVCTSERNGEIKNRKKRKKI